MASTEKLIELVKNYPILYDVSHEEYKNTRKKDDAWDEIADLLAAEEGGESVKKKFKNLRDTLARAIRQMNTRSSETGKMIKKWTWWDKMQFFRPFLNFDPLASSAPKKRRPNNEDTYQGIEEMESDSDNTILISNVKTEITPISCAASSSKTTKKPEKKPKADSCIDYFQNKKKLEIDDIDLLFLAHAKTVKTFSKKRQILAKKQVAEIIMQQELINFDEQSAHPSNDNYNSNPEEASNSFQNAEETYNMPTTNFNITQHSSYS